MSGTETAVPEMAPVGEAGEWEDAGAGAARVLNQDEIDDLLGLDGAPASGTTLSGLRRVVSAGLVSYERLPMLEIVFDRLVRVLSTSLRNLTSDNVEVSIDKIMSLRFGDYLNAIPLPAMLSVFKAEQWDNLGLMVVDASMIYSIVDTLLGGRRGTTPMRIEGRPYTTIERSLVEKMVGQVLADLSVSFDPVCQVTFRHQRMEVNPRFAAISRASNAAILVKLRLEMDERGGCFDIVLPYATLEPIRDLLLQQFMGERFGHDNIWETHLSEELRDTAVELDAVLGEQSMRLSEVLALQVGSQIIFPLSAQDPVELRCGGVKLFLARTGNRRNHHRGADRGQHSGRHYGSPAVMIAVWNWVADAGLAVLLIATMTMAVRLDRALRVVRRDRAAFETLINNLGAATSSVKAGIQALRAEAERAAEQIARRSEDADKMATDLSFLVEAADRAGARLEQIVQSAASGVVAPPPTPEGEAALGRRLRRRESLARRRNNAAPASVAEPEAASAPAPDSAPAIEPAVREEVARSADDLRERAGITTRRRASPGEPGGHIKLVS